MRFPDGRTFAFTILDDTDDATLENVAPIYERLRALGFRTTKTAWPMDCPEGSRHYYAADTLQRPEYLDWVRDLVAAGFELASHGATMETSRRERTEAGLAFFEREFGFVPRLHANHGQNRDSVYWGRKRFHSPLLGPLLARLGGHDADSFDGEDPASPCYWGDLCRAHVDYVRNFTFPSLDMNVANPEMPYALDATPDVRGWFSTTDAPDVSVFRARVDRPALERLERDGGVCIVSTHLGKGFVEEGRVDPAVDETLTWLATRPGWFVPVSTLLDHLAAARPSARPLGAAARLRLELRYLMGKLRERFADVQGAPKLGAGG